MTPLHPGDVVRLVHGSAERWAAVLRVTERGQVLVAHGSGPGLWYGADGRAVSGRGRIAGAKRCRDGS